MSLVIVGNESVDILGSYAKRYFSDVRNNQLEPIQIDVEAFDIEHTGLRIDVEILSRTKQLILQFPLRSQKDLWMTKSNKVIEYLLNSKESGTLYDTLKSQGYISDIVSTVDYHELVNAGVITINMTLTDKGVVSEDLIVGSFFNYISLMNQDTLKPQFGEVVKKQLTRAWEEMETGDPLDVAITLSNALHLYDPQFVVSHAYIMSEMNLRHIISILKDITPQKMRLWVLSDTAVTDTKLNYAKGSFSTRKLNLAEFDRWDKSGLQTLKLPSVNNEFENLSQEQVPLAKVTGKPQVMFDQFGKRLLFSSGKNVENGEGVITLRLNAHAPTKTAINWLASNIMVNNILSDLQPSIQRLKTATGSESSIYLSRNAEPIIQLAGNTQGHMTMLNTMLDKLLNYRMSKEEFEESVKLLSSAILDRKLLSIYDDMPYKFGQTVSSPGNQFSNDQLLEGLRKISIDDIFSFNTELLKSAFIDAFAMGHYDSNSLVAFMQKFRPNEPQYEAVSPWLFKMDSQKIINKAAKYSSQQDGVGLMTAYFKKAEIDVNTKVQMDVLAKLLSTPYLEFMRTENELGYIAQLFSAQTGNIPFVGAIVISNSEPRNILRDKSKAFFSDYLKTLKTVSSSEIKNLKESMIGDLQVPTTSLYEEYTYYFSDWEINEINFTSKNSQIKALNNVTRESIVTLYERLFLSTKSTKIEISIQNKNIN
jgi:secreted Zn-dependent insulinase-like peptidase